MASGPPPVDLSPRSDGSPLGLQKAYPNSGRQGLWRLGLWKVRASESGAPKAMASKARAREGQGFGGFCSGRTGLQRVPEPSDLHSLQRPVLSASIVR